MNRVWSKIGILVAAALAAMLLAPASAQAQAGLTVTGAKVVATASPGAMFVHQMTVSLGAGQDSVDISIRVHPMAQTIDGTPRSISEPGPYSAASFITLDKESLNLKPGRSETVNATIRVPSDVVDGGRYALISIATMPPEDGRVSVITGVDVPVYLTIEGSNLTHRGQINSLETRILGEGIDVTAILENQGNHDFKARANFALTDTTGATVSAAETGISLWTILPGQSRQFKATLTSEKVIPAGEYRLSCKISLEDGSVVAEPTSDIEISAAILPAVAPATDRAVVRSVIPNSVKQASNSLPIPAGQFIVPGERSNSGPVFFACIAGISIAIVLAYLYFFGGINHRSPLVLAGVAAGAGSAVLRVTNGVRKNTLPLGNALSSGIRRSISAVRAPPVRRGKDLVPYACPSPTLSVSYTSTTSDRLGKAYPTDKPGAGYVFLVVDLALENHGYESCHVHPRLDFSVVINKVKFKAAQVIHLDGQLPADLDLGSSGKTQGRLAFEVPRDFKSFTLVYDGCNDYDLRWSPPCKHSAPNATVRTISGKPLFVTYCLTKTANLRCGGITENPDTGNIFLVARLRIVNRGYGSFRMCPRVNTYLSIEGAKYSPAFVSSLDCMLPVEIDIMDGGEIEGALAFEVPEKVAEGSHEMSYESRQPYQFEWMELRPGC